jgi:hypothetical protein
MDQCKTQYFQRINVGQLDVCDLNVRRMLRVPDGFDKEPGGRGGGVGGGDTLKLESELHKYMKQLEIAQKQDEVAVDTKLLLLSQEMLELKTMLKCFVDDLLPRVVRLEKQLAYTSAIVNSGFNVQPVATW